LGNLYLINIILQMANTRNHHNNNNGEDNQDVNLPPPPPPTLEQVLIIQAQMLQTMQQTLVNMQAAQPQAPPRDRLGEFQRTKPPTFSQAIEPMDADDWLKSVEKKLQVVQCNNREKALLASHQLSGPAADWWDAYGKPTRSLKASTGQNLELLSVHIMFPKE
jgi:hypothetical protein